MAVYTQISLSEAQELFLPIGKITNFEGIKEGVENTNYLVHLNNEKKFILTLFELLIQSCICLRDSLTFIGNFASLI